MNLHCTILCSLILLLSLAQGREFTDSQGRKIEAEIVGYSGDTVIINRAGTEFPVPITTFSLDDQQYISEWIDENPEAVRYKFGYYVDLEKSSISQQDAPGGAYEDKLKIIPYNYEMIIYNKGVAPAKDIEIRYEIYIDDFVDVRGNRFTRLAYGVEKNAKLQTIAGSIKDLTIPANGRHDFERTFNTEFYIDRDGGKTDQAATDKVIGIRIRVYSGKKVIAEFEDGENDTKLSTITWQDETPSEGVGPTVN